MKQYECSSCNFVSTDAGDICDPKVTEKKAASTSGKYVCSTCGDSAAEKKDLCHPKE